jgi:hypothetical protein
MELNPEVDLAVDIHNLTKELRDLSLTLFRYYQHKAKVESQRDISKAKYEEIQAITYKRIKSDTSVKYTEKAVEAEITIDPAVTEALMKFIRAEHDAKTWVGAVESMKAKKDMLIQLSADSRKEK